MSASDAVRRRKLRGSGWEPEAAQFAALSRAVAMEIAAHRQNPDAAFERAFRSFEQELQPYYATLAREIQRSLEAQESVQAVAARLAATLEPVLASLRDGLLQAFPAAPLDAHRQLVCSLAPATPPIPPSLLEAVERVVHASNAPIRAAFMARALNALAQLTPQVGDETLGDAAGAPSDYAALLRALEAPGALASLRQQDPLAAARLRGLDARQELLRAEGGTLTAEQVARCLGITRQAVDKRRRAGKLIGLHTGRRGYAYPSWQLGSDGVLRGLEAILAELSVRDPWMQAAFFLSGDPRLDGATPLDELRRGNVEAVRRAARGYGEHGAA